MAQANIILEIFCMGISALLLLCCFLEVPASRRQTALFIAMLAVNIAVLLCDLLTWVLEEQSQYETLLYGLNFLVYSLGYVLTALFSWYLLSYIADRGHISPLIAPVIGALCLLAIVPVAVSLWNHIFFSFDGGVYARGPFYWLSQVYPIGIMLADMLIVVRHGRALGRRDTLSFLSYGALPVLAMLVQIWVYGLTLLYAATTAALLIIYIMVHVEQNRRMEQQKVELAQANVAIMLSQIQPHFLYNALNSIQCLCRDDPAAAEKATAEFSMFLRGNMDSLTMDRPIGFERELAHTRHYLALELLRFPDKLRVAYDIQTTCFRLPTLTLQPLVENAVRYGVTKKLTGGTVTIAARETEDAFLVTVSDDGAGFVPGQPAGDGRTHVGIANVRERLARMSGGTLAIESAPGVGAVAVITIPKEKSI